MTTTEFKDSVLCFSSKLYCIAYRILKDKETVEDVLQDSYTKLWDMRDQLSEIKSIEGFAVTMVKNCCIDRIRSKKIQCEYPDLKSESQPLEEVMDARDRLKLVKLILENLPERQRQIFSLRHFNDCSIEEISIITSLSEQNVRTILSRTRSLIKERIEDYE